MDNSGCNVKEQCPESCIIEWVMRDTNTKMAKIVCQMYERFTENGIINCVMHGTILSKGSAAQLKLRGGNYGLKIAV